MRLAKYVKKLCFLPILPQKLCFFPNSPYIRVKKWRKKSSKTLIPHQRFSWFFRQKTGFFPYMGPPGPPKRSKTRLFGRPATPPKIIKNRLNFACSKIPWEGPILPVWTAKQGPPPKIIKNRLNFAHSEVCEKWRFLINFVEITHPTGFAK